MVETGLARLAKEQFAPWRGLRLGLLCNPTAVDVQLRHLIDLAAERTDLKLVRLFGPEHGIRGAAQDMVDVTSRRDERTGLPVISLYGNDFASLSPSPASLRDLDALVFDLQDIGSRYYTFIWTMALAMQAAGRQGLSFWVLDRPNPLGGELLEGPLVSPGFESFVGLHPLPVRHGMTAGEIAGWLRGERGIEVDLKVTKMIGWRREELFDGTGLPWIPPSPNMPTLETALVYPGQCLLEGTNVSEGRGTTRPFEIFGAPFVDPERLRHRLEEHSLPGVRFRPLHFQPTFHKFAGQSCGGLMLHVTDRGSYRPFLTGMAVVAALQELWPDDFRFRTEPYEFVKEIPAFDLLCGSDRIRRGLLGRESLASLVSGWLPDLDAFASVRNRYLLYA